MSRPVAVHSYLQKRAVRGPWRIEGHPPRDCRGAVVIPALAESERLFATLASLQANPPELLERFLVLVVVNHRQDAAAGDKADNHRTLRQLAERGAGFPGLAWVDAAGEGLELPAKGGGVGLARKIGLDLALPCLDWRADPLLTCLDADTLVRADYLPAVCGHFAPGVSGAAVVPFCHPPVADEAGQRAMVAYELFLRAHVLGLELAGSPYAFHTVGSTMACRALDYVRAGGMNRRQAGEDFYFLQQVAKIAGVRRVKGTVVYPSARASDRTPFGTGRSVAQLAGEGCPAKLYYDPRCYAVLGRWLQLMAEAGSLDGAQLLERAAAIDPALEEFLVREGLPAVLPGLRRNHGDSQRLLAALHGWFDGLKTVRLVHHLTDRRWPRQVATEALPPLLLLAGLEAENHPETQLRLLRGRQISADCGFCRLFEKGNYCRLKYP